MKKKKWGKLKGEKKRGKKKKDPGDGFRSLTVKSQDV